VYVEGTLCPSISLIEIGRDLMLLLKDGMGVGRFPEVWGLLGDLK